MSTFETLNFAPVNYNKPYSSTTMQAGNIFFDAFASELKVPLPSSDIAAGLRMSEIFSRQERINVQDYVGRVGSQVVAIASLHERGTRTETRDVRSTHLSDLAVNREMRGRNVGSRFLGWLEEEAVNEYNSQQMTLVALAHNLSFYQNNGYEPVYADEQRQMYMLEKDLTQL